MLKRSISSCGCVTSRKEFVLFFSPHPFFVLQGSLLFDLDMAISSILAIAT